MCLSLINFKFTDTQRSYAYYGCTRRHWAFTGAPMTGRHTYRERHFYVYKEAPSFRPGPRVMARTQGSTFDVKQKRQKCSDTSSRKVDECQPPAGHGRYLSFLYFQKLHQRRSSTGCTEGGGAGGDGGQCATRCDPNSLKYKLLLVRQALLGSGEVVDVELFRWRDIYVNQGTRRVAAHRVSQDGALPASRRRRR